MARAARRGLENMKIQALLTATAINLKRLAKAILMALIHALLKDQLEQTPHRIDACKAELFNSPARIIF